MSAPERIWAYDTHDRLFASDTETMGWESHLRADIAASQIAKVEKGRDEWVAALEQKLAEARAEIERLDKVVIAGMLEEAQKLASESVSAEAERDRLAADLRLISDHVRPLVPKGQDPAQADSAFGIIGYMVLLAADNARLRDGCHTYASSLRGQFSTRYEVANDLDVLAGTE